MWLYVVELLRSLAGRAHVRGPQVARLLLWMWLLGQADKLAAAPDYYEFEGSVQFALPTFGLPSLQPNDPIIGGFNVDPATAMPLESTSADRQFYRVQRTHGFFALFGGIEVRADDFQIQIYNDLPQGTNAIADVVTVVWSSDLVPSLAPLHVDGTPRTVGQFAVSFFKDGGSAFTTPSLDALNVFDIYDRSLTLLSDSPGPVDVLGAIRQWQHLPGLPGDFDGDADVDGGDFITWQQSVGSLGQGDLPSWKTYFGTCDEAPESSPVPEPASTSVAAATSVALLAWVRRRRRG